jgi:dihydroflavonol-4-reductase
MNTILLTGATGFLGYHVAKRLNEDGIRPRVLELPGSKTQVLDRLTVDRCSGDLSDPSAVAAACAGAQTVLHTAFKVTMGGGAAARDEMRRINVDGTRTLLRAAAANGVRRAVVTGSALAVGVNDEAAPLNESAYWSDYAFDLPYATIRREAELNALKQAQPGFDVTTVCPSFTFGPDDPVGAPANKLLQALVSGKLKFTLPVGFGCLDVRDFAQGMVLAAMSGRSGERYLLSGTNVTTNELLEQAAAIAGVRAPRFQPPTFVLHALIGAVELVCAIRRQPAPVTRAVLQIIGRHAWYDTTKARTELGWAPRPLRQTLDDTIRWLRDPEAATAPAPASHGTAPDTEQTAVVR